VIEPNAWGALYLRGARRKGIAVSIVGTGEQLADEDRANFALLKEAKRLLWLADTIAGRDRGAGLSEEEFADACGIARAAREFIVKTEDENEGAPGVLPGAPLEDRAELDIKVTRGGREVPIGDALRARIVRGIERLLSEERD
jgi:hypothetical protein